MDEFELREQVIERFDIYDIVELLGLTTEELVDRVGLLDIDDYRERILDEIIGS